MPSFPTTPILYEQDYYLWLETTMQKIRLKQFSAVDWENLLLELESMGRSEKRTLESLLIRLKVANQRLDYQHKISLKLVDENQVISC